MDENLDTSKIKEWRSIVTLVVFIVTNLVVLFPFHVPIPVPRAISNAVLDALSAWRVISPRPDEPDAKLSYFVRLNFPLNFVTAPLVADLFLLAILAISGQEVHDGTIGANNISPIDIMVFFLTLAYIAISIDASGLIRYLAFMVLQKGGKVGHRLFFYLYAFFFCLGTIIGNDPIILSGTAFLAYMTRVSSNIIHPRAWIHTQFAIANIASAILVSSNPTNLVLAGAFQIKFVTYTANMIVPVVATAIVLFPFLLYIIFADESLIPLSIKMHELSEEEKNKKPVNPNIPHARGALEEQENQLADDEQGKLLSLEEIMNPFLDKGGATFGAVIMAATLSVLLGINAISQSTGAHPVFWVTLPAAFVMFCWDVLFGWYHREETRKTAREGRQEIERAQAEREVREEEEEEERTKRVALEKEERDAVAVYEPALMLTRSPEPQIQNEMDGGGGKEKLYPDDENTLVAESLRTRQSKPGSVPTPAPTPSLSQNNNVLTLMLTPPIESSVSMFVPRDDQLQNDRSSTSGFSTLDEKQKMASSDSGCPPQGLFDTASIGDMDEEKQSFSERISERISRKIALQNKRGPSTLVSFIADAYRWSQETFPTVMAVVAHLPFALVPFAFAMFVLVQALVTKGWVSVFAYGWDHWVNKTGTIGAVGGMGFLSVVLCNAWEEIHKQSGIPITNRTFWATVYGMALGVNYGAFSTAFSASLAGLLWRDILARKHIHVRRLEFARVNLPIISIAMAVGCAVLVGEVYIMRDTSPYHL